MEQWKRKTRAKVEGHSSIVYYLNSDNAEVLIFRLWNNSIITTDFLQLILISGTKWNGMNGKYL